LRLLRDRRADFERAGVRVFGASRDSHWSHRAWKETLGIDVPLLSDWNGALAKRFGAARVWRWMEGVPRRSAFLVGEDGTVLGSWQYEDSELPDFDLLLDAARQLEG
jgi:peroxiredoxin Q/BCP